MPVRASLLCLLLLLPSLAAQPGGIDPQALLGPWRTALRERQAGLEVVSFEARSERRIDGPMGVRTVRTLRAVTWRLDADEPEQQLLEAEMDGRTVTHDALRHRDGPLRRQAGPGFAWIEGVPLLPLRLLANTPARSPLVPDERGGLPLWRVELEGAGPRFRSATLWFERTSRRLPADPRLRFVDIEVQVPDRHHPSTVRIQTTYERRQGLDVPVRQTVEGVFQTRRRVRTFTLLVDVETTFDNVRILRR